MNAANSDKSSHHPFDFEEALEPPDLKDAFSNQDSHLKDAPPLDTRIRALCCVPMRALSHDNIPLFILDEFEHFRKRLDFFLQWILWRFVFRYIDNSVHVERDVFCVCAPCFVGEAIQKLSVLGRYETVIAARRRLLVYDACAVWVLDLGVGQ